MAPVRGRPLGLLGWLLLVLVDLAVGDGAEQEAGKRGATLVERGPEVSLLERKAA
jgi:hypothetical protein